jgi:NAD(P)-dependent dehydrogenase (short-subunit alcohol dehydrogenase family)
MGIPISAPNFSLEGKVAIVTGGGTGIGRGIALELAKAGADVVVGARRLHLLEETAKEVRALGRHSLAIQTDITKKTDVDNLVQRTMAEFGHVDILVNNAAHSGHSPLRPEMPDPSLLELVERDEDIWDLVIDTNLKGVYLCCRAVVKGMIERKKGNIINISSVDAILPPKKCDFYSIAKVGVVMLTRGLAWELGPYNIRVNSIAPGLIRTPMTENRWRHPEETGLEQTLASIQLGRPGQPIDIATVALFLASEASNYITGETIVADGCLVP